MNGSGGESQGGAAPPQNNVKSFFDTNILLYADDSSAGPKQTRALALLEDGFRSRKAVLSTQVLQEYFVNATRKLGIPPDIVRGSVEIYLQLSTVIVQPAHILAAIDLHRLHSISLWDSLIVHCAQEAKCTILYSEDMQHGRTYGSLRIVNPFL